MIMRDQNGRVGNENRHREKSNEKLKREILKAKYYI